MARTVTLEGNVPSAPYITDPSPLAELAPDTRFELEARQLTEGEREAVREGRPPFTEHGPAYAVWYDGSFVGVATGLAHAVRALLGLGHPVLLAAERVGETVGGYEGVELTLPEADHFERWYRFVHHGLDVGLDDPIVVVNLAVDPGHTIADGPVTVEVGEPGPDGLPVSVLGADPDGEGTRAVFKLHRRQHHSFDTLEPLAGRTLRAVAERRDSFTHRGTRYMKVFIDTARS